MIFAKTEQTAVTGVDEWSPQCCKKEMYKRHIRQYKDGKI
jgi:hypothetical protein